MPTPKFYGEQNEKHGGILYWPGFCGFPLKSAAPPGIVEDTSQISLIGDHRCKIFNLSNEEDKEYYEWVKDRIRNGLFTQDYIEYHWDQESKTMFIYLEWTQIYAYIRNEKPQ